MVCIGLRLTSCIFKGNQIELKGKFPPGALDAHFIYTDGSNKEHSDLLELGSSDSGKRKLTAMHI